MGKKTKVLEGIAEKRAELDKQQEEINSERKKLQELEQTTQKQMAELSAVVGGKGGAGSFARRPFSNGGGKGERPFTGNCFNCGKAGHRAADCPSKGGGKGAGTVGGVGENGERRTFPTPPKLPSHIRPRICKFGMKCNNARCTYIHIKPLSGRSVGALGLGDVPVDEIREHLTYEGGNLYALDDADMNGIEQLEEEPTAPEGVEDVASIWRRSPRPRHRPPPSRPRPQPRSHSA